MYVCMYVCIYIHMYIYMYTPMNTYIHTRIHTHTCMYIYMRECVCLCVCVRVYIYTHMEDTMCPRTEEIQLEIITTAKLSNKFSREFPYISSTFSRESPNFHTRFYVCKRSPRHSKGLSGKLIDLEIRIILV